MKQNDYPAPEELGRDDEWLVSDELSDDQIEYLVERNRSAFRRAWFEYISEFDS